MGGVIADPSTRSLCMSDATLNPVPAARPAELPSLRHAAAVIRPRLWPAVVILALQWTAKVLAERFWLGEPAWMYAVFFGPMIGAGLVLLWWLFASRVPWLD